MHPFSHVAERVDSAFRAAAARFARFARFDRFDRFVERPLADPPSPHEPAAAVWGGSPVGAPVR
jgi:hypothetical protein